MAVVNRLKPVRSDTSSSIKRKPSTRSTTVLYARERAQFLKQSRDYAFLSAAADDDDAKAEPVPVRPVPIKKAYIGPITTKKPSESIERKANDARLGTTYNKFCVSRSINKPSESIKRKVDPRLGANYKKPCSTIMITKPCSRSIRKPFERIKEDYYDHGGNNKKKADAITRQQAYYDKQCSDQNKITTKKRRVMKQYDDIDEEEEEAMKAIAMIREMSGYDPTKYRDHDRDDLNMEASYQDIQREERRSAKLARKEDADELRKLMGHDKKNNKKMIKQ